MFFHCLQANIFQRLRNEAVGRDVTRWSRVHVNDVVKGFLHISATKWLSLSQHFVHHDAEAENVRPLIDQSVSKDLLGRHIERRTTSLALGILVAIVAHAPDFRRSPIDQGHFAKHADNNIFGFDISMNDAAYMGVGQRITDLSEDTQQRFRSNACSIRGSRLASPTMMSNNVFPSIFFMAKNQSPSSVWPNS